MGNLNFIQYVPRHVYNLISNLEVRGINLKFVLKEDYINNHWLAVNKGQLKNIPQADGKDTWAICENCL